MISISGYERNKEKNDVRINRRKVILVLDAMLLALNRGLHVITCAWGRRIRINGGEKIEEN